MRFSRLTERIEFQKNTITMDEYGNKEPSWQPYFSCYAYADTNVVSEDTPGVVTLEERGITFETRYCPELAAVTSIGYRIVFHGEPYDIQSIDMMNYQKAIIRFGCRREEEK